MTDRSCEDKATPPLPVMSYGRAPRHSRTLRVAIMLAFVVMAVLASRFGFERAWYAWAYWRGVREVATWHAVAQSSPVPPGTLLYSANPADTRRRDAMIFYSGSGLTASQGEFAVFDEPYPALRTVSGAYYLHPAYPMGIPRPIRHCVIFAAERRGKDPAGGSKPMIVSVSYSGKTPKGEPAFYCRNFDFGNGTPPYAQRGAEAVAPIPDRPLTNLRIYAGRCDPLDDTRFTLPFECDDGRGRFEFRNDGTGAPNGGLTPSVWIEWDGSQPTTTPATARP